MLQASSSSSHKLAISIAIALVICAHAVPLIERDSWRRTWPVLLWALYKDSRPQGPIRSHLRRVMAISAAGERVEVTDELIGLGPPAITRLYGRPMLAGDPDAARRLFARLNRTREDPFIELRLDGRELTLTPSGVRSEPLPVITYRVRRSVPR